MSQPVYASSTTLIERIRAEFGRRAAGLVIALLLEAVIIGVLLTLSMGKKEEAPLASVVTTFDSASEEEPSKEPEAKPAEQKPTVQPSAQPQDQPQPDPQPVQQPVVQPPVPAQPAVIALSKNQMAQLDISNLPKARPAPAQAKPVYGPANTGSAGDSQRVGTTPNGQPMYAAQWYREPTQQELAGYLSTAEGPGWGLITCKTVPEYRVENCIFLDESPSHSNIARAALAAAWQFKVRPPRLGGKYKYGEWVRIRIDYEIRRQ